MTTWTRPVTAEELLGMPDDGLRYELVKGELRKMPPAGNEHGYIAGEVFGELRSHVKANGLGRTYAAETGFEIHSNPDTVRAPDVAFVSRERLEEVGPVEGYWPGAPDLAVEIVDSPKARREAVQKQVEYEQLGVREYWVIDLPRREVRQWLLDEGRYRLQRLGPGSELAARTVEGFHLQVGWLFQGPSFPLSLDVVNGLLAGK